MPQKRARPESPIPSNPLALKVSRLWSQNQPTYLVRFPLSPPPKPFHHCVFHTPTTKVQAKQTRRQSESDGVDSAYEPNIRPNVTPQWDQCAYYYPNRLIEVSSLSLAQRRGRYHRQDRPR